MGGFRQWWLWVCGIGGCGFVVGMSLVMGLCQWWYGCGSGMVLCRGGMFAAVVVVGGHSHIGCVLVLWIEELICYKYYFNV